MRTTININDQILKKAQQLCDIPEKTKLINHALEVLIEKYASMRLAALEGSEKALKSVPRRR